MGWFNLFSFLKIIATFMPCSGELNSLVNTVWCCYLLTKLFPENQNFASYYKKEAIYFFSLLNTN